MAQVQMRNEILFKAPTKVGLLADVTTALADAGVDLIAIGAYDKGDMGEFLLLTSSNKDAFAALEGLGGSVDLVPVVVAEVANQPGELAKIARRLAEHDINIDQIHATTTNAPTATIVLKTSCELDVVRLLEDL